MKRAHLQIAIRAATVGHMSKQDIIRAEVSLPSTDLSADLEFFGTVLGMRLETIFPADDPAVAVFSGHGLRIRLNRGQGGPAGLILIETDDTGFAEGKTEVTAPGGTRVTVAPLTPPMDMPQTEHAFVIRRLSDGAPWIVGRAGMHYRDLVPTRLGGSIIASHIRIPDGGPVPDMVHFHKVGFQLIFCYRGWVDVVYEDQGGPIRLTAGDCFIQPPEIRHRVLEASDGIEVIEIGVPAEHITQVDHDMTLPTPHLRPDREWQGQKFVFSQAQGAEWQPFRLPGYIARDTTIGANTKGVADVKVVRKGQGEPAPARHTADIMFGFVMAGSMTLEGEGKLPQTLEAGDAFVIPPGMATTWAAPSEDIEVLEVALPGRFETTLVGSDVA